MFVACFGAHMSYFFWVAATRPFALFVMLLIAWPIKRAAQLYMPEGRFKRVLLHRFSTRVAAFERLDQRIHDLLLRLLNACLRAAKLK